MLPFSDRAEAGRLMAAELDGYAGKQEVVVVALSNGGVPVGFEIATRLRVPLEIMIVRKLGVPWQPELAMGAVASGGIQILDEELIRSLNLSESCVCHVVAKEEEEIEKREQLYRNGDRAQDLAGKAVVLVDDGAATGSTMLAAVEAVRAQKPKDIVVAVPVVSGYALMVFEARVSKCVYLAVPEPFDAVGRWYRSFASVNDEQVKTLLCRSRLHGTEEN
jgi:putative phosphoribosyl transferase